MQLRNLRPYTPHDRDVCISIEQAQLIPRTSQVNRPLHSGNILQSHRTYGLKLALGPYCLHFLKKIRFVIELLTLLL